MDNINIKNFNGNLPCLNHRAAVLGQENNIIEELLLLTKSIELDIKKVELITVFLSQSGYISRRYTKDELLNFKISEGSICNCNTMQNDYDLSDLCYTCTLFNQYANRYANEEKQILSYCFSNINNRNTVSNIVKNRDEKLMRSYLRIGKDDTSSLYLQVNRMIYNFLCILPVTPRLSYDKDAFSDEYDYLYSEFKNNISYNEKTLNLSNEEDKYLRNYFISIYKESNNIKASDEIIVPLVKKMLAAKVSISNKKVSKSVNPTKQTPQEVVNLNKEESLVANKLQDDLDTKKDTKEDKKENKKNDNEVSNNKEKKHEIDLNNNIDNSYQNELGLLNHISYSLICSSNNVITVETPTDINSLDYSLLGNEIISVEIIKDSGNDYILLYLLNENRYYICNIKNTICYDVLMYYLADKKSLKKITYSSLLLLSTMSKYKFIINNYTSINTMYQMKYCINGNSVKYEDIIKQITGQSLDHSIPILFQGMKYYHKIFKELNKLYSNNENSILEREYYYEKIVADSYNIDDISKNKFELPHVQITGLVNGKNTYTFNYNDKLIYSLKGIVVISKYKNEEEERNSYLDAYKDVCIKCYQSNAYEKCNPRLLDVNEKNGLIFYIDEENYNSFFSILNRWLIKSGKKYISSKPVIEIETIKC